MLTDWTTLAVQMRPNEPHTFDNNPLTPALAHTEPGHAVIVGRATFRSDHADASGNFHYWEETRGLRVSLERGEQEIRLTSGE